MVIINLFYPVALELGSDKHEVFPYSIFYVYYEQYLTIWRDTIVSLSISFATIFVISFFLMGFNIGSALVIILTIFMIVINLIGMLYFWSVSLNAITLVSKIILLFRILIITFLTVLSHHAGKLGHGKHNTLNEVHVDIIQQKYFI